MSEFTDKVNNIYKELKYLDKYGGSIVITIIVFFIFFILLSYFSVISRIEPIKKNWNNQKCSPNVIPFAGLINKPHNMSGFDFTKKNFNECINNILESIAYQFIKPINNIGSIASSNINNIVNTANSIRTKISSMSSNFASIDKDIMGRIMNILLPLRYMLIKFKDTLGKVHGTLTASLYTMFGTYLGIKSFLGTIVKSLTASLVVFAGIILALILSFFGIPAAIPLLLIFSTVAIPTGIIIGKLKNIINLTGASVPDKPSLSSCFDEDTPIRMINGTYKPIKDIYPNEILYGNTLVTAKMKLSSKDITMYNYNDTIVSGTHSVYINGKLTKIKDVEDATIIENYDKPYIYCINTDSKVININNNVYCDWDEINDGNLYILYKRLGSKFTPIFNRKDIHKYMDGGFVKDTMITMKDGNKIPIQDVSIDDVIYGGARVYGVVEITTNNMNVYKTELQGVSVIGAPNIQTYNENLGHFNHLKPKSVIIPMEERPTKLYHILTENKRIVVDGCSFYDYNGSIDVVLKLHPTTTEYKKAMNKKPEYLTSPQFNNTHYVMRPTNKEPGLLKRIFSSKERRRRKYMNMKQQ
jgi:hypothetical protein